ncbi:MAG: hypothetical protein KGL39_39510 [Patescibacteria group bacterium]|nr:hypothetical protein [Patescibacteria group bacterium]
MFKSPKEKIAFIVSAWLLVSIFVVLAAYAQSAGKRTDAGITCAASGASTQVLGPNNARTGFVITNDSATAVRIGAVKTGTGNLDDTNSIILTSFSSQNDGGGGQIFLGRIVCMSTTASTVVIHVTENSLF